MPKDQRSTNERIAENLVARQILKNLEENKNTTCAYCDKPIGSQNLVGVIIQKEELTWCNQTCYNRWVDHRGNR